MKSSNPTPFRSAFSFSGIQQRAFTSCISVQTQISILEISDCLFHQIITTNMETMDTSIILFEFYGILIYTNNVLSKSFSFLLYFNYIACPISEPILKQSSIVAKSPKNRHTPTLLHLQPMIAIMYKMIMVIIFIQF